MSFGGWGWGGGGDMPPDKAAPAEKGARIPTVEVESMPMFNRPLTDEDGTTWSRAVAEVFTEPLPWHTRWHDAINAWGERVNQSAEDWWNGLWGE